MKSILVALTLFSVSTLAMEHAMPTPKSNKNFDQMKQLVGTWEGTTKMGDKEEPVKVTYELTSNGTAMIEKLFPGTEHEMTSVYHIDGNTVAMTHYCSMGNQPKMKLKKGDTASLAFEMTGTMPKEMHMHGLKITWADPTHITHEWTSFNGNKKQDTKIFNLAKK